MARFRSRWLGAALVAIASAIPAAWWLARERVAPGPIESAERALGAGDHADARAILEKVLEADPGQPRARLLYARLLRLTGQPREADVALGRAMDLGAPEADLWREYGLLVAGSDFGRAEPVLRRASGRSPRDVEVLAALAKGVAIEGRWAEAVEIHGRWLEAAPGRWEALIGRARALVRVGRPRDAAADLRAAVRLRPEDYQARLFLADCLVASKDMAGAAAELERCRRLRPDRAEPLVGLARCALEEGEPGRARDLLDQAVAADPSSPAALGSRGSLAVKMLHDDLARADFERVVALDRDHRQAHFQLAQIYRRAGETARADEHARAYRELAARPSEPSGPPEGGSEGR